MYKNAPCSVQEAKNNWELYLSVLNVPIVEEHQEVTVQKDLEFAAPVRL